MGQVYYPSGSNYFTGLGVIQGILGEGFTDDPPTAGAPPAWVSWFLTWDAPSGSLIVTWLHLGQADYVEFWQTRGLNVGEGVGSAGYYLGGSWDYSTTIIDLSNFMAGRRYGIAGRLVNSDGQVGPFEVRVFDCPSA